MKVLLALSLAALSLFAQLPFAEASVEATSLLEKGHDHYSLEEIAGTYLRVSGTDPFNFDLSQLVLHDDGTVYFNRSLAFQQPFGGGTFIPYVGVWDIKRKHVYVTIYGASFAPDPVIFDLQTQDFTRTTMKFRIRQDGKRLVLEHLAFYRIPLGFDPLTTGGVLELNSAERSVFHKAKHPVYDDLHP